MDLQRGFAMSIFDIFSSSSSTPQTQGKQEIVGGKGGGLNCGTLLGIGGLAAILGAVMPRSFTRGAALMGLGAVAYNFYQKWSKGGEQQEASQQQYDMGQYGAGQPAGQYGERRVSGGHHQFGDAAEQTVNPQDPTAVLMLRAMIYAARADGHIDEQERSRIMKLAEQFLPGADTQALLNSFMSEPLNIDALVSECRAPEQKEDLYRLSCLVVDIDHFMERGYLDALAQGLGIEKGRQQSLEREVEDVKAQIDKAK